MKHLWFIIWLNAINFFFYHACIDRCKPRMVNPTRIWKLKLEIKDLLFIAFQQINSRAFTNLSCLVKGMLYTLKTGQPCWVLVYSVLLLTLFSSNIGNTWWDWRHVRPSSWCHISTLVIVFFSVVYKLWRTYLLSNFWGTLFEFSNSVYNDIYYWSLYGKSLVIVISELTFEWGMLVQSKIKCCYRDFTRQTVRLLHLKCILIISSVMVIFSALELD